MDNPQKTLHKIAAWEEAAKKVYGLKLGQLNLRNGYVMSASASISGKRGKKIVTYDSKGRCFYFFVRMPQFDIKLSQE